MNLEIMLVLFFAILAGALSFGAHLDHDLQKECFKAAQVNPNISCTK